MGEEVEEERNGRLSGDDKISPMDPGRGLHLHPFTLL